MRIAVNNLSTGKSQSAGYDDYIKALFDCLAKQHPEHTCISLTNKHTRAKQQQPDIWVKPYGQYSLRTAIPQVVVVADLVPGNRLYNKLLTPFLLRKASRIIAVSGFLKASLAEKYKIPAGKIAVVQAAARNIFQPLTWQDKKAVKVKYAGDREYFFVTGGMYSDAGLLNLLKAFSLFKKWQHSNMQLVITGMFASQHATLFEKIKTYKYREDIVLIGSLPDEELAKLMAAAYALVHIASREGSGMPVLEAMQTEVPVIAAGNGGLAEIAGDAALYADPDDPDAIAKQMLALYKDENLRSRFTSEGREQAAQFSWEKSAASFLKEIVPES